MDPDRLTGFVYPVKKNGVPVRGRWQLWVNLPSEPAFDRDGQPVLDSKGRQKQKYPKTTKVVEAKGKKAAERLLETWIAELESHRTIDPDRLQLAELLDRWLEATRGEMRVASYNSYRRIRRIHVDPALGQVLAGKLTRAQLSTYYAAKMRGSKKKKPLAETTVAHHHAMLKTAYNWALEEELLLVNPALRVKNPPALRPKTRPVWSMEEIASTVIKARGLQVHAAGVLAGFSGLRVGEIAGLLWSDLDLARGFVTVSRTIEEDDDGTLLEYPPKNGKARTVPLPAAACDELRVWLAAQKEYRLAQGPAWNEAGRVVPKKDGTPDGALDPQEPVVELGRAPEDRPAPADPRPARLLRHLGLRDLRRQAGAGVARALRPGDHAAALRAPHDRRAGEGRGRARRGDAGGARAGRGEGPRGRPAARATTSSSLASRRR